MPGPARAGALIYAKDLERLSAFYQALLGMTPNARDSWHHVLGNGDLQLVIHAIPDHIARTFEIATPPHLREEQAIKLFFTVEDLASAEKIASAHGGGVFGPSYPGPGFVARNAFDPEGNIFHLRAFGS